MCIFIVMHAHMYMDNRNQINLNEDKFYMIQAIQSKPLQLYSDQFK